MAVWVRRALRQWTSHIHTAHRTFASYQTVRCHSATTAVCGTYQAIGPYTSPLGLAHSQCRRRLSVTVSMSAEDTAKGASGSANGTAEMEMAMEVERLRESLRAHEVSLQNARSTIAHIHATIDPEKVDELFARLNEEQQRKEGGSQGAELPEIPLKSFRQLVTEAFHRVGDFSVWILLYMSAIFYAVTLIQDCHEEMKEATKRRERLLALMRLKLSILKDYPDVVRSNVQEALPAFAQDVLGDQEAGVIISGFCDAVLSKSDEMIQHKLSAAYNAADLLPPHVPQQSDSTSSTEENDAPVRI